MNEETTSWSSWNPAKLKQAISVELLPSVSQGNSNIEKGVRQKNETVSITKGRIFIIFIYSFLTN